jgi:septum formation topological specificity factor MinE
MKEQRTDGSREKREAANDAAAKERLRIVESLERARQAVKPLVKRELRAEVVSQDFLTVRLKCRMR